MKRIILVMAWVLSMALLFNVSKDTSSKESNGTVLIEVGYCYFRV